ncbi:MAG: hypothetical protein M3365_05190 [Gemmatimonadota bacterium]|nr:hypothetical protein [Gemmatimonadota bacterium]
MQTPPSGPTLAPWDPPRHLVIRGPWAPTFFVINAVYIPLFEEPQLKQRFGPDYIEYCKHVPRLVPRFRPWQHVPLRPFQ